MKLKRNMGTADIIIRAVIVVTSALLVATKTVDGTLSYVLLAVAGIFTLTAITGFCPIYASLGLKTYQKSDKATK